MGGRCMGPAAALAWMGVLVGCGSTCPPGTRVEGDRCAPDCPDPVVYHADVDGDGFGDPASPLQACSRPRGFVDNDADCDDDAPHIAPGQPEVCNGVDDDCDGAEDDGFECSAGATTGCTTACGTTGTVTCTAACTVPDVCAPPAEQCNLIDDDCDGVIDDGVRSFGPPVEVGPEGATRIRVLPTAYGFAAVTSDGHAIRLQRLDPAGAPLGTAELVLSEGEPILDFDAAIDPHLDWLTIAWFQPVAGERHLFVKTVEADGLSVIGTDEDLRAAAGSVWVAVGMADQQILAVDAAPSTGIAAGAIRARSDAGYADPGPLSTWGSVQTRPDLHAERGVIFLSFADGDDIWLAPMSLTTGAIEGPVRITDASEPDLSPVVSYADGEVVVAYHRALSGTNRILVQRHDPDGLAQIGSTATVRGADRSPALFDATRSLSLVPFPLPDGRTYWATAFIHDAGDAEEVELRLLNDEGFKAWGTYDAPLLAPCPEGSTCTQITEVDLAAHGDTLLVAYTPQDTPPLVAPHTCN